MIRLFAGLALAPDLAARLDGLALGIPNARRVEARNLHLTLRFIGEVPESTAQDIHDALVEVRVPPFPLALTGFATFGGAKPHSLIATVEKSPVLARLRDKVDSAVVRAGQPPEPRKFLPHVTLARLKEAPLSRLQAFIAANSPFAPPPMTVESFHLFVSHLSRNGPEYEAVASYPLGVNI